MIESLYTSTYGISVKAPLMLDDILQTIKKNEVHCRTKTAEQFISYLAQDQENILFVLELSVSSALTYWS